MQAKLEDHLRLYFQNVNGFQLDVEGGDFREFCHVARETQSDLMCATEHNTDTNKYHIKSTMEEARRRVSPTSKLWSASSPIETSGNYKPGGTLMLTDGPVLMRLIDSDTDDLGRWTYNTYAGKDDHPVTFIVAYQVCKKPPNERGKYTAATQQEACLRRSGAAITDPRKAFRKDLKDFIQERVDSNHDIVLFGDFNEELGDEPSGMPSLCSAFGLVDVFEALHGPDLPVATYSRGTRRLDYVLATPRAAGAAVFSGYEPFGHRIFSDHRAMFVDFDTTILFGSELAAMPPLPFRDICSNNPTNVTTYIEELHRMCDSRNVFDRAQALFDSDERDDELAERISRDMDQFRTASVKQLSKRFAPAWSEKIAKARNKVGILKRALFMCRTAYDVNLQLEDLTDATGADFTIPPHRERLQCTTPSSTEGTSRDSQEEPRPT